MSDFPSFTDILTSCNILFVNYETGKTDFDKKEFKELLKIYKSIYPAIMPASAYEELSYGDMMSLSLDNFFVRNSQKDMNYVTNPLTEYLISQMDGMLENIKEPMICDKFVFDAVNECIKDYLDGKKTEDQVAKQIDNKVNIFFNE